MCIILFSTSHLVVTYSNNLKNGNKRKIGALLCSNLAKLKNGIIYISKKQHILSASIVSKKNPNPTKAKFHWRKKINEMLDCSNKLINVT